MIFTFETTVQPDWIDYNAHMRDAYFGLIFSLAVDAFQDEIGFDAEYRERTGCTIYLLEEHKYYLREVKEGALVRVEAQVLGCDAKRFHLHMTMYAGASTVAVGEFMELHVDQHPKPHAVPMPPTILQKLQEYSVKTGVAPDLNKYSRKMALL